MYYGGATMQQEIIEKEIDRLKKIESRLLYKFVYEAQYCTDKHLSYISGKIFEISDLIVRLNQVLKEIQKNED